MMAASPGVEATARPFTFAVSAPPWQGDFQGWTAAVRDIERAGFDALVVADHFTGGWDVEPMVALTSAAAVTSTLRVQTGVLGNDYRHPVQTHRLAATLDAMSGGRVVLGLGAGWLRSDYDAAGLSYDRPGVRIERLGEAVDVITALFGPDPVHFTGRHYRIDGLVGVPRPVQLPRPPLLLGGGSPRMLRLAGSRADIVSVVASLRAGAITAGASADLSEAAVADKVGWIAEGSVTAGRSVGPVLSINHWLVRVTSSEAEAVAFLNRVAARQQVPAELLRASPAVLVGPTERLVDDLEERRARYGFSHLQLDAGFAPADVTTLYPLVAALAGR